MPNLPITASIGLPLGLFFDGVEEPGVFVVPPFLFLVSAPPSGNGSWGSLSLFVVEGLGDVVEEGFFNFCGVLMAEALTAEASSSLLDNESMVSLGSIGVFGSGVTGVIFGSVTGVLANFVEELVPGMYFRKKFIEIVFASWRS